MDPVLVVSPHLDDAVLSVGQYLECWPGITVLTVFAGMPDEEKYTTFDVNCGFAGSTMALTARWHEDDRALRVLNAKPYRLDHIDNQYRTGEVDMDKMIPQIVAAYNSCGAIKMVAPLGLMHVDHELTARACGEAARRLQCEFWTYEDIPSRVTNPESVAPALLGYANQGWAAELSFLGNGDIVKKEEAVKCYTSQQWALDPHHLYVPERVYRMTRTS